MDQAYFLGPSQPSRRFKDSIFESAQELSSSRRVETALKHLSEQCSRPDWHQPKLMQARPDYILGLSQYLLAYLAFI